MTSSEKKKNSAFFIATLKANMEKYGLNQPQLAKITEIPQSSISAYLKGKTEPEYSNIEKIATGLGLTLSQFFTTAEAPPIADLPEDDIASEGFLRVPLAEDLRLAAGGGGAVPNTYEAASSPVVVHRQTLKGRSAHMLQAFRLGKDADSMEPLISAGGLVIADKAQDAPKEKRDVYVLCWDLHDGECAVKYLKWGKKDETVLIESENRRNESFTKSVQDIKIIGRVIWSCREHKS